MEPASALAVPEQPDSVQACRDRLLAQAIHYLELALKFRAEGYHELSEHYALRSSHASRFIRKIDNRL